MAFTPNQNRQVSSFRFTLFEKEIILNEFFKLVANVDICVVVDPYIRFVY